MITVDFAGEVHRLTVGPFVIGRDADLCVDENPFLHRRFLELRHEHGLWWLLNIGSSNTATISDSDSGVHAWLAPGGRMPIVFGRTRVQFTAGPTTYELELALEDAVYEFAPIETSDDGDTTIGKLPLTADQRLMVLALCEGALARGAAGMAEIPSAGAAAKRLGWTQKKFEKKLDNVCERLSTHGVRGLKGGTGDQALSRRARLVQYAVATRMVVAADLPLLDRPATSSSED